MSADEIHEATHLAETKEHLQQKVAIRKVASDVVLSRLLGQVLADFVLFQAAKDKSHHAVPGIFTHTGIKVRIGRTTTREIRKEMEKENCHVQYAKRQGKATFITAFLRALSSGTVCGT